MPDSVLFGVRPDLVATMQAIYAEMAAENHPMRACQGVRTAEYQLALFHQGRDLPGLRRTNADGFTIKSNHQSKSDGYGWAVDSCFTMGDPFGEDQPWDLYGAKVKAHGLIWGGDWPHFIDRPHAELPGLPPSKGPQVLSA